jgi:hypothetical protein
VLRDGGRLGVIWTSRDRAKDWVAELDLLRLSAVPGEARGRGAGEPRIRYGRNWTVITG